MYTKSIWLDNALVPEHEPLYRDIRTDVAVIGGGLAGILTAYYLKERGIASVVLEADRIGSGQTENTTAKVTSQHNLIYHKMIQQIGKEKALQYKDANQKAIAEYKRLIDRHQIECGWADCTAYLYTESKPELLEQEYLAAKELGYEAQLTDNTELPFPVRAALGYEGQARFHPLKFLSEISKEVQVFEKTVVERVEDNLLITNRGKVRAEQVVFACHYPFVNVPGYYFMKMHQERSYVIALDHAPRMEGMYLGIDDGGLSFREAEGKLLLGGGGHRTGENQSGGKYEYLEHMAWKYWPECKVTARWSAQDCMTLDGIPYIGVFSRAKPYWSVATGFGKWGMTSSMVSAMILSDQISGKENPYETVFSPQRVNIQASAKNFIKDGAHAATDLLKQAAVPPKDKVEQIRPGHGGIVDCDGEKCGVYRDEEGKLYVVSARCPHLGCQLSWNPDEKSFDCPCHGSRFDYMGRRIDGPAQEDVPIGGMGE